MERVHHSLCLCDFGLLCMSSLAALTITGIAFVLLG
ncbi:hypothetical protein GGR43_003398 [Sphingobium jiangsuense]|uniref:Uncharacterized protein n=1 Tax=Sphingobium jiangsuense TaxID=870476 RepID=A0A7W6BIK1_9SPHN|nr:hypothetical protein [Sphingobium jiangsuense]